jgi:hypothetical protein
VLTYLELAACLVEPLSPASSKRCGENFYERQKAVLFSSLYLPAAGAVFVLLLLAVILLCGYEISAVYVSAGRSASRRYSPSAFFFGVSAIALGINMLFICKMVFHGEFIVAWKAVRQGVLTVLTCFFREISEDNKVLYKCVAMFTSY